MTMKIPLTGLVLLLAGACSSAPTLELGRDKNDELKGAKFFTELPGFVRLHMRSRDPDYQCQIDNVKSQPVVTLKDADDEKYQGRFDCSEDKKEAIVKFPRQIKTGNYRVLISEPGRLGNPIRGVILFAPIKPEIKSGANQNFQGASELKMGVNEGDIAPALGNRTDWWKIEVPALTATSVVFQNDTDIGEVEVPVFRTVLGHMKKVITLMSGKPRLLHMEGVYYFAVQGAKFGKSTKYSLALAKMDSAAARAQKVKAGEDIPITDLWPISGTKTAIVLGAGNNSGIKVGDIVKIFAQNGKLIDGCTVSGVSESESECAIESSIKNRDAARARRSL